jgi:hypothetical protein
MILGFSSELYSVHRQAEPSNPLRDSVVRMKNKRKQYDEDFKRVTIQKAHRGQSSTGAVARVMDIPETTADSWGMKDMPAFMIACHFEFGPTKVCSVAWDASRFGSPKEDTELYVITDGYRAAWLPCMVLGLPATSNSHIIVACMFVLNVGVLSAPFV